MRQAAQFAVRIRISSSFECTSKQNPGFSPVFPTLQAVQGLSTSRGDEFSARGGRRRRGAAISTVRIPCPRGCSSAGRAPALQAGGQRFEPAHLHQHIDNRIGLSRSPECRKAKLDPLSNLKGCATRATDDVTEKTALQRLRNGYRSNKLVRVRGGCLGTKSRRKTRLPAISAGELEANDDPAISEWGNPLEVMLEHPWLNT